MAMRLSVIDEAFAVEVGRDALEPFRRNRFKIDVARNVVFPRFYGFLTGVISRFQSFLDAVFLGIHVAFAADAARIEHADGGYSLHALIRFGCVQRVSAATADAQGPDAVLVDAGILADIIDHAVDIFRPEVRHILMTRFTATGTLEGRISSNGHITGFGQLLGIQAGDLFLDAAIGRANFFLEIIIISSFSD